MDPVTIGFGAAGAGALAMALRRRAARLRAWRAAADACGVQDVTQRRVLGLIPSGIRGRVGPLAVTLESGKGRRDHGRGTLIRVQGGIAEVSMRRKGLDTTVQRRLRRAPEVEMGDPAFDAAVYAEGSLSVSSDAGGAVSIASEGGEVSLDVERNPR